MLLANARHVTQICFRLSLKLSRVWLLLALVSGTVSSHAALAQTPGQTLVFPIAIQWTRQSGVNWYRLQISSDPLFRDVYYDRRIMGDRFRLSDLPPGPYFWRVAPSEGRLGAFSRPMEIFVSGGVVTVVNVGQLREARDTRRLKTDVGG